MIFDIDGTLVDTFSVFTCVFNAGTSQFSLQAVSQQFLTRSLKKGVNLGEMLRMIFPPQTDESLIETCRKRILEQFLRIEATEVKLFPGTIELFRNLTAMGLRIGIATGRMSMPENEWERFKRFGLEGFIDSIVTSREVARRKPAPDAVIECGRRMKVAVERCLVVGDTEDDVIAARQAGGVPVVILTGEDPLDLSEAEEPEFVFKNLFELTAFLKEQERSGSEGGS